MFTQFDVRTRSESNLTIDMSSNRLAEVNPITQYEFLLFQELLYQEIGINLTLDRKSRIESRLINRLVFYGFTTYFEYYQLIDAMMIATNCR